MIKLKNKKVWQIGVFCVSFLILAILLKNYDFSSLTSLPKKVAIKLLLVGLSIFMIRVYYLKSIFNILNFNFAAINIFYICSFSEIISYGTASVTNPVSKALLAKNIFNITYKQAATASILEICIAYAVRMVFVLTGLFLLFPRVRVVLALSLGGFLIFLGLTIKYSRKKKYTHKVLNALQEKLIEFKNSVLNADKNKIIYSVVLFLGGVFLSSFIFKIILNYYGYQPSLLLLACIKVIGFSVGVISLVPLGLGSLDITTIGLLVVMGISKNDAITTVILSRAFISFIPAIFSITISNLFLSKYVTFSQENKSQQK